MSATYLCRMLASVLQGETTLILRSLGEVISLDKSAADISIGEVPPFSIHQGFHCPL